MRVRPRCRTFFILAAGLERVNSNTLIGYCEGPASDERFCSIYRTRRRRVLT
jgi:hypothetical protein